MNKPLTVEELKELKTGDWVWLIDNGTNNGEYVQCSSFKIDNHFVYDTMNYAKENKWYSTYGDKWIAYKNKEQAENN